METITFLNLYQQERILWDRNDPKYHNIHQRLIARERIAGALGITVERVGEIFNLLRGAYVKESRKMAEDNDYSPTMEGFQIMATIMKQLSTNTLMAEEDDTPCDVCKSPLAEVNNEMIFCDKCNVCVHQACYGVNQIPQESWHCKPCELNIQPTCLFCLQSKGAMKDTSNGQWAHVSCSLWIPEASFADPERMETITNIEKIPKTRWNLSCVICHKRGGACIQCYVPKCKTAYHVTCAYKSGLHMEMEDVETSESEVKFESFCKTHSTKSPKKGTSVNHSAKKPITEQSKFVSYDENFAQNHPSEVNIASTSIASTSAVVSMTDVSDVEKTIVKNGNRSQMVENKAGPSHKVPSRSFIGTALIKKGTARKSFPVSTQKIDEKKQVSEILPKIVKTNKPQVRTKVPKRNTPKRKANQSSASKPAELELPSLNNPGTSGKKPKLDKQLQSNKTPQNLYTPNPSDSAPNPSDSASNPSAIRNLFPSPEKVTAIPNKHGLTTGDGSQTIFNNHPPPGSGDQSPSTETGLQEIPNNNQLKPFLGYMESILRPLPLKKSLKIQGKLISYVLKEHDVSSSDELSDVSSVSD